MFTDRQLKLVFLLNVIEVDLKTAKEIMRRDLEVDLETILPMVKLLSHSG